jgi:hypothetical protein
VKTKACEAMGTVERRKKVVMSSAAKAALSFPLRSSSSQRHFRGLFISGGAVGEAACVGGDDGAGQCRRGGGVIAKGSRGSVWVLFVRVAGLPRNLRRFC